MSLLERDAELAVLAHALALTASGRGSGVAVGGEAGAGKSALVGAAIATQAAITPVIAGTEMPLSAVCEAVYEALGADRTILVVEDLHWVDAASVEVLRFLVRRIDAIPLTLAAAAAGPRRVPLGTGLAGRLWRSMIRPLFGLARAIKPLVWCQGDVADGVSGVHWLPGQRAPVRNGDPEYDERRHRTLMTHGVRTEPQPTAAGAREGGRVSKVHVLLSTGESIEPGVEVVDAYGPATQARDDSPGGTASPA